MADESKLPDFKQVKTVFVIHPGVGISVSHPQATAIVIQPFIIEIAPSEGEYLATSRISNVYELGAMPGQAVMRYLKSLVDELVWLQKHQKSLSASIREELRLLQSYVTISFCFCSPPSSKT